MDKNEAQDPTPSLQRMREQPRNITRCLPEKACATCRARHWSSSWTACILPLPSHDVPFPGHSWPFHGTAQRRCSGFQNLRPAHTSSCFDTNCTNAWQDLASSAHALALNIGKVCSGHRRGHTLRNANMRENVWCRMEGGAEAASLRVAEQYMAAFGNIAKTGNTMLLPASTSDPAAFVAQALSVYNSVSKAGSSSRYTHTQCPQ